MSGPMLGYMLSAYTLTNFIEPNLTPTITNEDPRWIGAWWMGEYSYLYINTQVFFCPTNKSAIYRLLLCMLWSKNK